MGVVITSCRGLVDSDKFLVENIKIWYKMLFEDKPEHEYELPTHMFAANSTTV